MNEKITASHLGRKSLLYVRQSSLHQVAHNQESRRLQYAMKERLQQMGWSEIEVIDEDLGRSASGSVTRSGFERIVVEVSLGRVGAVCAREVSRFARNSREWQQLVEVCRLVDTLLIDQETIYDPRRSNDRLLLGLKGSLNEYELDLLRHRAQEARFEKARRGELMLIPPVGYLQGTAGHYEKDPDRRIQQALEQVFEQFRHGTTKVYPLGPIDYCAPPKGCPQKIYYSSAARGTHLVQAHSPLQAPVVSLQFPVLLLSSLFSLSHLITLSPASGCPRWSAHSRSKERCNLGANHQGFSAVFGMGGSVADGAAVGL